MWTSSNPTVATVGFYTGIVEAVGPGEVAIRATSVDGSHVDCCIVKVLNPFDVKYINITKDNSGKYSIILTKFNNDDFYFQAYGEENDEWGELYSLSWTNINWLNDTYNSYYSTYISQGNVNTSLIGHRVYLAKNKLINTINAGIWNITVNSDEFYGMWMHYTRVEVAYLEASQLVAQMLQTAVVIGTTIYKAVVTIKSIATLINQRKYISSESYQSTINGINAMNQTGPDASQYSSTANLLGVQNTENFKPGSINHVLKGEINKNGNAVGYYYEGFSDSAGSIIIGTKTNANEYGVYKTKVSVNGINKISNNGYSTFFPKTMSPQQIIDATNQAYNNRKLAQGNTYIGVADNGLEIAMYLDNADKIVSFFSIY